MARRSDILKPGTSLESYAKLRENLYNYKNGYYLSKNDPLFWRKLLNRLPENEEAMYHVGLELENEAKIHLTKYYTTKVHKFLLLYRKVIKQSFDLLSQSFNKGFFTARFDVLRMEREMILADLKILSLKDNSKFEKNDVYLAALFIIAIITAVLATLFIIYSGANITNYANNNYTYMLPYEVIDKKPTIALGVNYKSITINVKRGISKKVLVNELVDNLKKEYEKDASAPKQIIAVDENSEEIGMALWPGGGKNIDVYVYPADGLAVSDNKGYQLWETTTVVRSALYQYVKKNGYLPKDLNDLTQPFPNNYLTDLPKDPYKLNNKVTTTPNGDGGWLFSSIEMAPQSDLISVVKEAVKPNISNSVDIPFEPLSISIDKENHSLSVMAGGQIIRRYSVAVGKDDTTPEGDLEISKKVMNPDKFVPKSDNVYGTRAMELSNLNYAVHGTNTPSSVGKDVSQGCIRLNNTDMEDLYAIIPLNTYVNIFKSPVLPKEFANIDLANQDLYNHSDNSKEDNAKIYHWGG
ncbi:conserved hypothetical protein [Candidatus Desulfosporosinus infrequens]|uniref:L,D-TPase catalytic domain-containing protein n=1 Tax=Candidatus Desulfosporosinus infrequens TaxID=2043169 RepID=A0A2U3KVZ2_9FIRM|nr:conserved hypothetical protein [Candidatus Desulfosporosinus infrequens]